ncbi:MAG: hypothetical protein KAW41_01540 [Candidatus Diapherotrites archaeon]|nr:hypothetical protein [Candidatus Diapherotrites archaeon]
MILHDAELKKLIEGDPPLVKNSLFPFASLFPGNPLGFARRQKPWGKNTRFARGVRA